MARRGAPGTIRGEAAARGVTEYQVRIERAAARGVTPSVAVGKPRRGELTLTERRKGISLAGPRTRQPERYQQWWTDQNGEIRATLATQRRPDIQIGDRAYPDPRYPSRYLTLTAITVAR